MLYSDVGQHIERLSDTEAGKLFKALFHYTGTGDLPENLDSGAAMAFSFIRAQIDRDGAKYDQICAARSEAGRKGANVTNGKRSAKSANAVFAAANPPDNEIDSVSDSVSDSVPEPDILHGRRKVRQGLQTEAEPGGDFNSRRNAWTDALKNYK